MEKTIKREELIELREEIDSIYTPLSVAKEEIWRRWNDEELRKKVNIFINGDVPDFLKDAPKAYLARQVLTPNFDFFQFLKLAVFSGLDFVCPEFIEDKFSAKNSSKYFLGKMFFHNGKGKRGGHKIGSIKIIDFNKSEGKKISELETLWGENLVEFHHKILNSLVPDINDKIFDISSWLQRNGGSPDKFYRKFLALFICNGILFENFLLNKEEGHFTEEIILPIFKELEKEFGVKPLIVNALPIKNESGVYWGYHPGLLEIVVRQNKI